MRSESSVAQAVLRFAMLTALDRVAVTVTRLLAWTSWLRRRELRRRDHARPQDRDRWFTPDETALLTALAALVVPSDEVSPGATEAGVVPEIERWVAGSVPKQGLYGRGLLGFDEVARREYGRVFCELADRERLALVQRIDEMSRADERPRSVGGRLVGRARKLYRVWRCPAVELFPLLVQDVLRAFYTSRVSWRWLQYDGPPMPDGYADLLPRARPS